MLRSSRSSLILGDAECSSSHDKSLKNLSKESFVRFSSLSCTATFFTCNTALLCIFSAPNHFPKEFSSFVLKEQLERYKRETGQQLKDDRGAYNRSLKWCKLNRCQYPFIWMLAKRILNIPATSAPSERVFSVAANIFHMKKSYFLRK